MSEVNFIYRDTQLCVCASYPLFYRKVIFFSVFELWVWLILSLWVSELLRNWFECYWVTILFFNRIDFRPKHWVSTKI